MLNRYRLDQQLRDDVMNITDTMHETLAKIFQRAPALGQTVQNHQLSDEEIANRLISLYRETSDLETRQYIMAFMTDAGYAWLRKLFIREDFSQPHLEIVAA